MYIVSFCLVSFSKVNIYGCLLTTKHKKASLFSLTLKAPHKSKWVSFGMLDECRQCVCFFSLFSFVKFAQVVIFSIFSQIGGYSNNGTKYLIFNIFHILGNCHKQIVIFLIFFIFGLFFFKQQIWNKSILFPKYVSQNGENWTIKKSLGAGDWTFNIFQKIGVFLRFLL